tara:strand:- start:537 stop:1202 length:666 start_codon:yes stop_codon:yes gene_type:complete
MHLKEKLNEFLFNLETARLLQSYGRTNEQITNEMSNLNFPDLLLNFQSSACHLYDSVMLRLRLYSENSVSENEVRQSLSLLNNSYVNALLQYLYSSDSSVQHVSETVEQPVELHVSQPVAQPVSQPVSQPVAQDISNEVESEVEESEDDENPFDSFFESCVQQTDEATDIVKGSDFYQAFSEWWQDQYEDNVPDKKELKNYLNEKLGKSKKSTWTNVVLSN